MTKYLTIIILFCCLGCSAYEPITCQSNRDNLSNPISNLIKTLCSLNKFNDISFITKVDNINLNSMIEKDHFFIISTSDNLVYMPYKLFKEIVLYLDSDGKPLVDKSCLSAAPQQQWLTNITNNSYLVELPVNLINDVFTYTCEFLSAKDYFIITGITTLIAFILYTKCRY